MEAYDAGIGHQAPPTKMAFWKENDMKRFGVLLASAALGAAVAASGPALAFGGGHGGGFGGGHMGGGFGGGHMGGGFGCVRAKARRSHRHRHRLHRPSNQ
jgi:hypothetical protein